MGWTVVRFAVLIGLVLRLVAVDQGCCTWFSGPLPALLIAVVVAAAVVTEPNIWLRRTFLALVVLVYAAWMIHDERWRTEAFWLHYALLTLATGVAVGAVEGRAPFWSALVALPIATLLGYMLIPGYAAAVVYRMATWLTQALVLLAAMRVYRALAAESDRLRH